MIFSSIQDGLNFRKHCPICADTMVIDSNDAVLTMRYNLGGHKTRTLTWANNGFETLTVDLDTNVYSVSMTKQSTPVYGIGQNLPVAYIPSNSCNFSGIMYFGLGIDCQSCSQYSYSLRVAVDTSKPSSEGMIAFLNSEALCIDEEDTTHEIINWYSAKQTQYTRFDMDRDPSNFYDREKVLILPLIPLDISNPTDMLQRIKILTPFS
jgi:hypothetical protein